MIYTPLTCAAIRLAYDAHHGQEDSCGMPYICHPLHLAESMDDEVSTCVALLHDVAEDTKITLEDLKKQFPPQVTEAVALMTHDPEVPYLDYIRRLKDNPIAVKVKRADIAHNTDFSRFAQVAETDPERIDYFHKKYAAALAVLDE